MPGQPGPVYPPGQFSGWNRPSVRASWLGLNGNGDGLWDSEAEPGYSILATSDPSADATVTQTWAVIDEAGGWSPPPPARDVSAHTDGEGFPGFRAGGPAAAPRAAFEAAAPAQEARSRQLAPWESGVMPATGPPTGRPASTAPPAGPRGAPPGAPGPGRAPARVRRGQSGAARSTGESRGGGGGSGSRRGGGLAMRSHRALIGLLMAPVVVVILVAAVIVYLGSRPVSTAGSATEAGPALSPSATPTLGPWQHITSQAVDSQPLSTHELYPARFTDGGSTGHRTVQRTNTKCTSAVIGSALQAAVRQGGCTQVVRASYLSGNRKVMATIGVLNLADVAAAEKAGKASGAAQFIRQLPGRRGPTRNLTKGTGIEVAEVKGHYLILIWTEFANLGAPKGKKQRRELTKFSADLFAGTANVSLTSRMVTGRPANP
ncbi:MAG TPA: hypothetical protein VEH31_32890 [Streptosporangiaceae bacterium]|nr:hypothetical protein [Streptosporangiaceae bacterium]